MTTHEEIESLRALRSNKDIIVLPADKGNATVIMHTQEYHAKMEQLLTDNTYAETKQDPTTYLEKILYRLPNGKSLRA